MKYRIDISPRALSDVESAVKYIRQSAMTSAAKWYDRLMERIESLAENPGRCPLAVEAEFFGIPLRELLFGKRQGVYRILFTIEGKIVFIHTIRHGARRRLGDD